jgi:hypothetical protein
VACNKLINGEPNLHVVYIFNNTSSCVRRCEIQQLIHNHATSIQNIIISSRSQISDVSITELKLKTNLISIAISHSYIDKNRKSSLNNLWTASHDENCLLVRVMRWQIGNCYREEDGANQREGKNRARVSDQKRPLTFLSIYIYILSISKHCALALNIFRKIPSLFF